MKDNSDILLKIKRKNPWWQAAVLISEDEKLRELGALKYPYHFSELDKIKLFEPGIYTIRGIRQIGKSTAIKTIIRDLLLSHKVESRSVFYFSCDGIHEHQELFDVIDTYLSEVSLHKQNFIFIDEVTFVDEWQRAIKELADDGRLSNATVLLTGSNLIDLRKSSELLPGRRGRASVHDINISPLTFKEFVGLVKPDLSVLSLNDAIKCLDEYQTLFKNYLLCGGIPKVINEYFSREQRSIPSYIYDMYRSWILGDILKAKKSEAIFESIIAYLIKSLATPVSWYKIGKESHLVSHTAAMDYVELLERMFVVKRLEHIDLGTRKPVFRKNKKIYFSDPFVFDALLALNEGLSEESWMCAKKWIDTPENVSKKVEQAVVLNLGRENRDIYYWLGDREVDIVVKNAANLTFHEIKYQSRVSASEFLWFNKLFKNEKLTVYTQRNYDVLENITCIPTCLGLLYQQEEIYAKDKS